MSETGNVRQGTALADAVKNFSDDEYGTDFLRSKLQLGKNANSAALQTALLQWCYSSRNFGVNPTVSAGSGTGADDDSRMQVDPLKRGKEKGKGKHQNQKGNRTKNTKQHEQYRHQHVQELWQTLDTGRKTAGDQVEEPTTIPPVTTATHRKARTTGKATAKANKWTLWKQISHLKQPQPCRTLHKHLALIGELSCISRRGTERFDRGCDTQFRVFHKETSWCIVVCFLTVVHSFTHVQSSIQDKQYLCLVLESTQQVEQDYNTTEDDW